MPLVIKKELQCKNCKLLYSEWKDLHCCFRFKRSSQRPPILIWDALRLSKASPEKCHDILNYVNTSYNYSQTYDVPSEVVCPQSENIQPNAQVLMHDPEDILVYWTPITRTPRSTIFFGTRKQIFREEVKETENDPKDTTATVLSLTAWINSSWFIRTVNSMNQTRKCEDTCLIQGDFEGEKKNSRQN